MMTNFGIQNLELEGEHSNFFKMKSWSIYATKAIRFAISAKRRLPITLSFLASTAVLVNLEL